jgi:hypothetical protein
MSRFGAIIALALCAASAAHAQETPSRWIVDARSGCRLWSLAPSLDERIEWSGACVGGYGQGHGTLKWYVGGAFVEADDGMFVKGMLNGQATLTFADGERFHGEFRGHLPNGRGTLKTADGQIYSGAWTDGCFDDGKRRISFGVSLSECKFVS